MIEETHNQSSQPRFRAALVVRVKNGYLWEAALKIGSIRTLAEHLGIPYSGMCALIGMRYYPSLRVRESERWKAIEEKLLALTGLLLDDIFPPELAALADSPAALNFGVVKEIPMSALPELRILSLPPMQEITINAEEMKVAITAALDWLLPRQADVIRLRFGLEGEDEHNLQDVAKKLQITRERVRQIEAKALRNLRQPGMAKPLKSFYE